MRHCTFLMGMVVVAMGVGAGCNRSAPGTADPPHASATPLAASTGLILQPNEGERRVRRAINFPFIIKVDRQNGGSPDLVMFYEDIPPGEAIPAHRHLLADEIVFIHSGSGVAAVGQLEKEVTAGATVYIPKNTRITIKNTSSVPMTIAAIFSKPGFEEMAREESVPEGQEVVPLPQPERTRVFEHATWHTVYDQIPGTEK